MLFKKATFRLRFSKHLNQPYSFITGGTKVPASFKPEVESILGIEIDTEEFNGLTTLDDLIEFIDSLPEKV